MVMKSVHLLSALVLLFVGVCSPKAQAEVFPFYKSLVLGNKVWQNGGHNSPKQTKRNLNHKSGSGAVSCLLDTKDRFSFDALDASQYGTGSGLTFVVSMYLSAMLVMALYFFRRFIAKLDSSVYSRHRTKSSVPANDNKVNYQQKVVSARFEWHAEADPLQDYKDKKSITKTDYQYVPSHSAHGLDDKHSDESNQSEELKKDSVFCQKFNDVLEEHYGDESFDVGRLVESINIGHRQLARKVRACLNLTLVESIRHYRLKKAAVFLKQGMSPSVVAYQVGFTSHSYFCKCFKAKYFCLPSQYRDKNA